MTYVRGSQTAETAWVFLKLCFSKRSTSFYQMNVGHYSIELLIG